MQDDRIIVYMGNQPPDDRPRCSSCGKVLKHGKCPKCKPEPSTGWRAL